ncbi:MAG: TlpA disulfide reductase family protein [Bacteroidota bacterium]
MRFLAIHFFLLFTFSNSYSQDSLLYPSLPPGLKAPCIKGNDETGKSFSLSKIKSRYTLLYFYEVHCHLCEVVTPELKKLYDSYHQLGLEIIAIPVESNREEWIGYISEHALTWKNIFPEQNKKQKLKDDYKLTVSPTMYLLDRKKIILTQRMGRIDRVEEQLNLRIR